MFGKPTDSFREARAEPRLSGDDEGDFDCAREYFRQAVDTLRPAEGPAPADPQLLAFSFQLYESALRYEALAGPAEEAGTSDGQVASELKEIADPSATAEAIVHAKEAVNSDTLDVKYDVPITINDSVLKVLAAFQSDLHGVISRGLGRSGMIVGGSVGRNVYWRAQLANGNPLFFRAPGPR